MSRRIAFSSGAAIPQTGSDAARMTAAEYLAGIASAKGGRGKRAQAAPVLHMTAADLLGSVLEKPTQNRLVEWIYLVCADPVLVLAIKNEATRPKWADTPAKVAAYYADRIANGVLPGAPDLLVLGRSPRIALIEAKRPVGGVLSAKQIEAHAKLRALGIVVGVATCEEEARPILLEAGFALRNVVLPPVTLGRRGRPNS